MTRDEHRAECIEAMKAAGKTAIDRKEFDNLIEKIFDSLHGIARVVPVEATEDTMSYAGDLTNLPEKKP